MNKNLPLKLFFFELKIKDTSFSVRLPSELLADLTQFAEQRDLNTHAFLRFCLITKLLSETSTDIYELPSRYQYEEFSRPIAIKINSELLSEINHFITNEDIIFSDFIKSSILEGFKKYHSWK